MRAPQKVGGGQQPASRAALPLSSREPASVSLCGDSQPAGGPAVGTGPLLQSRMKGRGEGQGVSGGTRACGVPVEDSPPPACRALGGGRGSLAVWGTRGLAGDLSRGQGLVCRYSSSVTDHAGLAVCGGPGPPCSRGHRLPACCPRPRDLCSPTAGAASGLQPPLVPCPRPEFTDACGSWCSTWRGPAGGGRRNPSPGAAFPAPHPPGLEATGTPQSLSLCGQKGSEQGQQEGVPR